ncbi:AAA family ATPase [Idiomarina abyssalis]|uniref:AAA family ATPase n=1 Tax=Idiomarina abyssalis TaxID=86102 RepID=UPI003A90D83D
MIKSIKSIKNYGVYKNVSGNGFSEFKEKNIIYGWNYSGKTTLSRIFSSLETGTTQPSFKNGNFALELFDGSEINPKNIQDKKLLVRVFNSDFIEKNLKWDGENFNPILLLGEDSIQAEERILYLESLLEVCSKRFQNQLKLKDSIDSYISSETTKAARKIKNSLGIVQAYTASHVDKDIRFLPDDPREALLDNEEVSIHLKKALSAKNEKLDKITKISKKAQQNIFIDECNKLITKTPKFSSIIDYLKNNPSVSNWVEQGLKINKNKEECEFCKNKISPERLEELDSHFSRDLINYKNRLSNHLNKAKTLYLKPVILKKTEFYPEFRNDADICLSRLNKNIKKHNIHLENCILKIEDKIQNPFTKAIAIIYPSDIDNEINNDLVIINSLIEKSNKSTDSFEIDKLNAISLLKNHYLAQYYITCEINKKIKKSNFHSSQSIKYKKIGTKIKTKIYTLRQTISKAKNGSQKINEYISSFLGRDEIKIEVSINNGYEQFSLLREGKPAKNLSEGEKSAIAFSFFLTKLAEITNLKNAIIYIDDPISSLDSNHIFQINALIKDYFFEKEDGDKNNSPWRCKCKQIFISTHNFEFLSLLKELPLNSKKSAYFQTKRKSNLESTIVNLPKSIEMYSSEYHYLFSLIYNFHTSEDKESLDTLLYIPNAVRRFVELYTYSRVPSFTKDTVDQRAEILFGSADSKRILKVLHYFSHLNNIDRIARNSDLLCDINSAVEEIIKHLKKDKIHFRALISSLENVTQ